MHVQSAFNSFIWLSIVKLIPLPVANTRNFKNRNILEIILTLLYSAG